MDEGETPPCLVFHKAAFTKVRWFKKQQWHFVTRRKLATKLSLATGLDPLDATGHTPAMTQPEAHRGHAGEQAVAVAEGKDVECRVKRVDEGREDDGWVVIRPVHAEKRLRDHDHEYWRDNLVDDKAEANQHIHSMHRTRLGSILWHPDKIWGETQVGSSARKPGDPAAQQALPCHGTAQTLLDRMYSPGQWRWCRGRWPRRRRWVGACGGRRGQPTPLPTRRRPRPVAPAP